jgi:hypothetical protein
MRRRDIPVALAASAIGSVLLSKQSQAQSCSPPCYAQTTGEAAVGVTPTNTQFPPGDVRRHGAIGDGSVNASAMYAALGRAWTVALSEGSDIYAPAGVYDVGAQNMPWRQSVNPVTSLLDCKNLTIRGDGPATVFKTTSAFGADVFQLNGLKNFHVRNLAITATLTGGSSSGSNGISVTGGFDNVSILDVWCISLPSLDKSAYIDGGKALTIQTGTGAALTGSLKARIFARACAEGFGYETDLDVAAGQPVAIDVDVVAEDCHTAVKFVAVAASGALSPGMSSGLRVKGQAINCMRDVAINRLHGGFMDVQVITTKSASARRLSPVTGSAWQASDTVVEALLCTYAKNALIRIHGNKGACDYKARIGAISPGASGLNGGTEFCEIYLDIGGAAATSDVHAVESGGTTMGNSYLFVSSTTTTTLPAAFYSEGAINTLTIGAVSRMMTAKFAGSLLMAFAADGTTESGRLDLFGLVTGLQGKATSTANAVVAGLYDSAGVLRLGIVNGGGIVLDGIGSSSALGSYIGKHPVYNGSGTFLGWVPIYA